MKTTKKIIAFILVAAITICSAAIVFAAEERISIKASEVKDGRVKVYVSVSDYNELAFFDWMLSYDNTALCISESSGMHSNPANGLGDLAQLSNDPIAKLCMQGKLMTAYNSSNPGKINVGFSFENTLGTDDEVVLFTVMFDVKEGAKNVELVLTEKDDGGVLASLVLFEENDEAEGLVKEGAKFELVPGASYINVYAKDCENLAYAELDFKFDKSVVKNVSILNGVDARLVNSSNFNNNAFTFESDTSDAENVRYGFYFKDNLWSSERFAAEDRSGEADVNGEYFNVCKIELTLAEGKTMEDVEVSSTAVAVFSTSSDAEEQITRTINPFTVELVEKNEEPPITGESALKISLNSALAEKAGYDVAVVLSIENSIGFACCDMSMRYDPEVMVYAEKTQAADDVVAMQNFINRKNGFIYAANGSQSGIVEIGVSFKDYIWPMEKFLENKKTGVSDDDVRSINVNSFDMLVIYFNLAEGKTINDIVATLDFYNSVCFIEDNKEVKYSDFKCIGIGSQTHTHQYSAVTNDAGCTQAGLKTFTCSCGDVYTEIISAKGHLFSEWKTTKAPTLVADGEKARACSACDLVEKKTIEKIVPENEVKDNESKVSVKFDDSSYDKKMTVDVKKEYSGEAYKALNSKKGNFKNQLFDITTKVNDAAVQPKGSVLVGLPLPEGYSSAETVVYFVAEDGSGLVKMPSYYENGYVWFETSHFSAYALVDESEEIKYSLGDVDNDGNVTAADARLALRASVNLEKFERPQVLSADTDKNGSVTASDARTILRVSVKLEKF